MHLKRKMKEKRKARHFELIPAAGCLHPGERAYIQAKFTPAEEVFYSQKMMVKISQSACRHTLSLTGRGRELRVEFSTTLLQFGPILPHSSGQALELTVTNPTPVPVEIYSVDFDKRHREEEDILRSMKGYDNYNTLLLPPRAAGDKLAEELLQHYAKQLAAEKDDAVLFELEEETLKTDRKNSASSGGSRGLTAVEAMELAIGDTAAGVGELELTPVTCAIARYLGIDLSPAGKAAMNRRGVGLIVHGPPLCGKTTQAMALAKTYGAALLTLDGVLSEAIRAGSTTAAIQAREKCFEVAMQNQVQSESRNVGNDGLSTSMAGSMVETALRSRKGSQVSMKAPSQLQGELLGKEVTSDSSTASRASVQPTDNAPLAETIAALVETRQSENESELPATVLPEETIVDILEHRLRQSDCVYGIVFDGLDSKYTASPLATASIILRAFNNRKWIFFVHVGLELMQASERQEARRRTAAEKEKREQTVGNDKEEVGELSEGEYEALSHEEQEDYDRKKLEVRKKRMREKAEKEERERKEQELLQAQLEEKRLEEER